METQVDFHIQAPIVDTTIEALTLVDETEGVSVAGPSLDESTADVVDDADVTDSPFINAIRNQSQQEETYSVYKSGAIVAHLYMEGLVEQGDDGFLFPNGVYYDSALHVLSIGKNQLQIPAEAELGISEKEVGVVFDPDTEPVILSFASGPLQILFGPSSIQWDEDTKGFLDSRGTLAFDLAGGIAVANLALRSIKCGPYREMYNPIDLPVVVRGKFLQFGDLMSFDFQRGIVKMASNTIKVPWQSVLNLVTDGVEIEVNDVGRGSSRRLFLSNKDGQITVSGGGSQLVLPAKMSAVCDNKGYIVFELDHQLVLIHLAGSRAQLGGVGIQFQKGSSVQIARGAMTFQEGVSFHGESRLLRFGQSRVSLPKHATLSFTKDTVALNVKKKQITMMPSNKQIFIRVGGKLVILTVTVGVAIDQNGNLAFDYRGNLALMDTNMMVLNIDGVKLDLGRARGAVVELIGNTAIVSAQSQPTNFMDIFKQMMSGKGLLDLIKQVGNEMSPEELIELLLSMSDPKEILALLQQAGVQPDGALLERLKELLMSAGGMGALLGQSEGVDASSLLMLTQTNTGSQVQVGGRNIPMPTSMETTEALMVGGLETMLARIKGRSIALTSVDDVK